MSEMNYDPMTGERLTPIAQPEPARPRFTASFREKLCAFLMFIPAYFYAKMISDGLFLDRDPDWRVDLGIFLLGTIALTILLFLDEKTPDGKRVRRGFECIVWFVCLGLSGVSAVFNVGSVWWDYQKLLFIHGFLLYWILSFSGRLTKGESSSLLLLDALNVLFTVPFRRYFYRLRTMIAALRDAAAGKSANPETADKKSGAVLWTLLAILAAGILFPIAVTLLASADENFAHLVENVFTLFGDAEWGYYIGWFFLSLPVAAYVFGVLDGFRREEVSRVQDRGVRFLTGIRRLRQVPPLAWSVLILIFSAVYTVFFVLQWDWVIDAFRGVCPADPRTYARESFFALLWVSLINFLLLGITHNSARDLEKKSRILTAAKILLLLCNIVFCIISFSKLVLYISAHGFTMLRLQSSWLVLTLLLACIAIIVNILSGRKTMKYWMIVSALLLAGLTVIA